MAWCKCNDDRAPDTDEKSGLRLQRFIKSRLKRLLFEAKGKTVHRKDDIGRSAVRPIRAAKDDGEAKPHKQRVASLFEENNSALIRFLKVRLHSEEEAREIAQEAYVKLLGLDEPDAVNHFRAYLFRTAANLAADRLRQRHRRAELRTLAFAGDEYASPSPEKALDAVQELALIREAVKELPPKCRAAFLMHKVHQLPVTETARRMRLSVRMVQFYVARGLAHCTEKLQAAEPDATSVKVQSLRRRHDQET